MTRMFQKLRRKIRPPYDPASDPVLQQMREASSQAVSTAKDAYQSAMNVREERERHVNMIEAALLNNRLNGGGHERAKGD
jgi:hypothetical protein